MKYQTLLEVRLKHPYYADTICRDFIIEPTADTAAILRKQRCVIQRLPDGARISMAVTDDNAPFIALPPTLVLTFHLACLNPDFALFTDLTAYQQARNPTYTNRGAKPQLALESRVIMATQTLYVNKPAAKEVFMLATQPALKAKSKDFKIFGSETITKVVSCEPATRVIVVNTKGVEPSTPFTVEYPTDEARHTPYFAAVEIHHDSAASAPTVYALTFVSKKLRWNYTLLTDREDGTFDIRDQETPALHFRVDTEASLEGYGLAQTLPSMRQIRFVSDEPIGCQQSARKGLRLYLNDQLVMKALPNPSPHNLGLIAGGERSAPPEEALYHVIKYVIRS